MRSELTQGKHSQINSVDFLHHHSIMSSSSISTCSFIFLPAPTPARFIGCRETHQSSIKTRAQRCYSSSILPAERMTLKQEIDARSKIPFNSGATFNFSPMKPQQSRKYTQERSRMAKKVSQVALLNGLLPTALAFQPPVEHHFSGMLAPLQWLFVCIADNLGEIQSAHVTIGFPLWTKSHCCTGRVTVFGVHNL